MEPALRLCSALPGAQRLGRRMGQLPPPHLLQGKLAPAVHSAFSPIPWLCILESLRGFLSPTPHFYSSIRFIHSPLGAVAPPISFSPPFAFPPPPPALSSLPPTAPILFYVRPLGLFARRIPICPHFPLLCSPAGRAEPYAHRVQVPRTVGLVRVAHLLAEAAPVPRGGRAAARALPRRLACHGHQRWQSSAARRPQSQAAGPR